MPDWFYNAVGMLGPILFLIAYLMLSLGVWTGATRMVHVLNLAGAVALLISLIGDWNLPMFVMEVSWGLVSLYGIWRTMRTA